MNAVSRNFRRLNRSGKMTEIKLDYFVRRLCEEKEAAARAASPEARAAHEALAARYLEILAAHDDPRVSGGSDPCVSEAA